MPPKARKQLEKTIRLRNTNLFLTYPNLDEEPNLGTCYVRISECVHKLGLEIMEYIVCGELHKNGKPHVHAWLKLNGMPGTQDCRVFDLPNVNGKTLHGSYEEERYPYECALYATKGGNYITSLSDDELTDFARKAEEAKAARKCKKVDKGTLGKLILDGAKLDELTLQYPQLLFGYKKLKEDIRAFKNDVNRRTLKPLDKLDNLWIWGPSGTGKSQWAQFEYPDAFKKEPSEFWGSYDGEETVLLEDVDYKHKYLEYFKQWFDHYPFPGKVKHEDPMTIRFKKGIVTCNYTIQECFTLWFGINNLKYDDKLVKAMERRFIQIRYDENHLDDLRENPNIDFNHNMNIEDEITYIKNA